MNVEISIINTEVYMSEYLSESELDTRLPEWMEQVQEFSDNFRDLDPDQSALVVVDMQKEFLVDGAMVPVWGGPAILPRLSRLIDTFRHHDQPVIYTKHSYYNPEIDGGTTGEWWKLKKDSKFLKAGRSKTEIHPQIAPRDDEYVVTKQRYSGFHNTNLAALLRKYGVRDVVIAGAASNCCCEATAHDALFNDFHVFFLADGTGGSDERGHVATLRDIAWTYGTVLTCADVTETFEKEEPAAKRL